MATKVVIHQAEINKLLAGQGAYSGIERDFVARAQNVLDTARGTAPVDSGDYRDHLHLEVTRNSDGIEVQVGGASSHDYEVEARTGNLARALDSAASA